MKDKFVHPYIPNSVPEVKAKMMEYIGIKDIEELYEDIPRHLRFQGKLNLPDAIPSEYALKRHVEEILSLRNVCMNDVLEDINLTIRSGEILGVAGLVGSGRTALARAIFGADPIDDGEIVIEGERVKKMTPKAAISKGIGFVTEDRKKEC